LSDPNPSFAPHDSGSGEDAAEARSPRKRRERRRKRVTPALVEFWATRHLERYASSSQNLRQVLARKIERVEFRQQERFPEASAWIETAVERMHERGYLDDRRYAEALCQRLRARGSSRRRLAHELHKKGVPQDIASQVLADDAPNAELEAAIRYARRRRIGPYRRDPQTQGTHRERDLAALGRAGFGYETARRIVDAADPAALENAASA